MESSGRNHYQTRGSTRGGASTTTADRDLLLQWGNRKRVRCTKTQQHREDSSSSAAAAFAKPPATPAPAPNHRVLRRASPNGATRSLRNNNTEDTTRSSTMRGTTASHHHHQGSNGSGNGQAGTEDRKGSSSGSEGNIWPKFAISLTNKEKEEDFLAFKGSKLPQRPKKRAKLVQRTINLVSPGLWLCDLTLERYEVREKKVSKKRPRGLRAMHNMDSDSE